MKLKNYAPAANQVLLELKEYTGGNVITLQPQHDKIMKVLKVGPMCTALNPMTGKTIAPGDFAMFISPNLLQQAFEPEVPGDPMIQTVQASEFGIGCFYLPDPTETKYQVVLPKSDKEYPEARELNVIDNPGVDKAPYLKEEADNLRKLNNE